MRQFLKRFALAAGAVLLVAQLVPATHDNPPSDNAKSFYTAERVPLNVESILRRSCHSARVTEDEREIICAWTGSPH